MSTENYYPGLNKKYIDSIGLRSQLNPKNIDLSFIDSELQLLDPVENKYEYHEKKNEKIVIK